MVNTELDTSSLKDLLEETPTTTSTDDTSVPKFTCPKSWLYIHNQLYTELYKEKKLKEFATWIALYRFTKRNKTIIIPKGQLTHAYRELAYSIGIGQRLFFYHIAFLKRKRLLKTTQTDTHVVIKLTSNKEIKERYDNHKMSLFIDTDKISNTHSEIYNYLRCIPFLTYAKRMKKGIIEHRYINSINELALKGLQVKLNNRGKKLVRKYEKQEHYIPMYKRLELPILSNEAVGGISSISRETARNLLHWAHSKNITIIYKRISKYGHGDEEKLRHLIEIGRAPKHAFIGRDNEILAQDCNCYFPTHDTWYLRERSIYYDQVVAPAMLDNSLKLLKGYSNFKAA